MWLEKCKPIRAVNLARPIKCNSMPELRDQLTLSSGLVELKLLMPIDLNVRQISRAKNPTKGLYKD